MTEHYPVEVGLSVGEEKQLKGLEKVIQDNFLGFVAVGNALAEIRKQRLYRTEQGRTFQEYCAELWEMQKTYAYSLIGAAQVIDNLSAIADKTNDNQPKLLPTNEAQARELARLEPEEQQQVWLQVTQQAKEGKPITARRIKNQVKSFKGELFDKTRQQIEKNIDNGIRKNGIKRSEAMQKIWREFWDQVNVERAANWRHTARQALFSDIETLLNLTGSLDGPELREHGCSMQLSDREKLTKAGFRIFRMRTKELIIEEWLDHDNWITAASYESPARLAAEFKELMLDPLKLKG